MTDTVKPMIKLMEGRLKNRMDAIIALQSTPLDGVPERVLAMREEESSKIRAVIQEQRDLLEILKAMYPDV